MNGWRELRFPVDSLKKQILVVEDDRGRVLADPLRWKILETLGDGKSVAELSQSLEVTDSRVLYHLKRLAQTGVVYLKKDGSKPGQWRCLPAAGQIRVRELPPPPKEQVPEAMPADIAGQFNQAVREAAEGLYGMTFQTSVNHNRARLSQEQASEFSRRLLALIEEYFPPGKGDRGGIKYGFYGVLTPIDLPPLADSEATE